MTPERQRCPAITFIDGSKVYRSTGGYGPFNILLVEDPTVTLKLRAAIKALFLYFNLCVILVSVSELTWLLRHILIEIYSS